jgi:hypothetical protein
VIFELYRIFLKARDFDNYMRYLLHHIKFSIIGFILNCLLQIIINGFFHQSRQTVSNSLEFDIQEKLRFNIHFFMQSNIQPKCASKEKVNLSSLEISVLRLKQLHHELSLLFLPFFIWIFHLFVQNISFTITVNDVGCIRVELDRFDYSVIAGNDNNQSTSSTANAFIYFLCTTFLFDDFCTNRLLGLTVLIRVSSVAVIIDPVVDTSWNDIMLKFNHKSISFSASNMSLNMFSKPIPVRLYACMQKFLRELIHFQYWTVMMKRLIVGLRLCFPTVLATSKEEQMSYDFNIHLLQLNYNLTKYFRCCGINIKHIAADAGLKERKIPKYRNQSTDTIRVKEAQDHELQFTLEIQYCFFLSQIALTRAYYLKKAQFRQIKCICDRHSTSAVIDKIQFDLVQFFAGNRSSYIQRLRKSDNACDLYHWMSLLLSIVNDDLQLGIERSGRYKKIRPFTRRKLLIDVKLLNYEFDDCNIRSKS